MWRSVTPRSPPSFHKSSEDFSGVGAVPGKPWGMYSMRPSARGLSVPV
jgi:hypothetical protein